MVVGGSLVATVTLDGLVTAVAPGNTTIVVSSEGQSGGAMLTVTPAPVASVTVGLAKTPLVIGETTQANEVLRDARGNVLTGRTHVWTSSMPSVATVNSSGLVTAIAQGTTAIVASSEGQSVEQPSL